MFDVGGVFYWLIQCMHVPFTKRKKRLFFLKFFGSPNIYILKPRLVFHQVVVKAVGADGGVCGGGVCGGVGCGVICESALVLVVLAMF